MARGRPRTTPQAAGAGDTGATVGYEAQLWKMADALRGSMDAAEYKHVVLGLIFLKYISDAFEETHARLEAERAQGADPEDPDEYRAQNTFWVPPEARWAHLKAQARQPTIGRLIDDAMGGIERDNPGLKGVLPKDYARPALDKARLGQLIDLISDIRVADADARSKDVIGRVYEYFLSQLASAEGKKGGEFYTPRCVVKLLVEMLEPYKGRVYDPCCGSSGMFVQSIEFIRAHATGNGNGGRARADISIYGQESNYTTWRLAKMNLAIRGIDGQIAHGDTFHDDRFPDLEADFILANPPFNVSDWGGDRLRDDKRWQYGVPPAGNANFAWVQHIVHHLAPRGVAGFVLANGSMSSGQSGEGEIRRRLVEDGLVDCMVALPGQLFYSTQIPACLWFLARDRRNGKFRDRRGEVLFIDARKLGRMVDRTHRELTDDDIAGTYHLWRGEKDVPPEAIARVDRVFKDEPGGLVVDYIGLAAELKQALATYTSSGGQGCTVIDQEEAVAVMLEKYEVCCDLFHRFDRTRWTSGTPEQRLRLLPAAQQHILAQANGKDRYLAAARDLSRAFALAVPHPEALRIRDDVAFLQAVQAALAERTQSESRPEEELDHAVRQIISRAVAPEGVIDIFAAAGLQKPDISILSDEFLAEVRGMPQRNLAVEVLHKLLRSEIKERRRKNIVRARSFAEMLEQTIRRYQDRAIEAAQVIEELIQLAKDMRAADARGEELGLNEDELALYDALETNDSAVEVLGDATLRNIARELVDADRRNLTIDWTMRENVRAQLRVLVKRILRKYGYPPDKQEKATQTILEQVEVLSSDWLARAA